MQRKRRQERDTTELSPEGREVPNDTVLPSGTVSEPSGSGVTFYLPVPVSCSESDPEHSAGFRPSSPSEVCHFWLPLRLGPKFILRKDLLDQFSYRINTSPAARDPALSRLIFLLKTVFIHF